MKMTNFFKSKSEEGISLVALVITIIVIIIIAAVAFSQLSGENSIIARAKQSGKAHEESSQDELNKLGQTGKVADEYDTTSKHKAAMMLYEITDDKNDTGKSSPLFLITIPEMIQSENLNETVANKAINAAIADFWSLMDLYTYIDNNYGTAEKSGLQDISWVNSVVDKDKVDDKDIDTVEDILEFGMQMKGYAPWVEPDGDDDEGIPAINVEKVLRDNKYFLNSSGTAPITFSSVDSAFSYINTNKLNIVNSVYKAMTGSDKIPAEGEDEMYDMIKGIADNANVSSISNLYKTASQFNIDDYTEEPEMINQTRAKIISLIEESIVDDASYIGTIYGLSAMDDEFWRDVEKLRYIEKEETKETIENYINTICAANTPYEGYNDLMDEFAEEGANTLKKYENYNIKIYVDGKEVMNQKLSTCDPMNEMAAMGIISIGSEIQLDDKQNENITINLTDANGKRAFEETKAKLDWNIYEMDD